MTLYKAKSGHAQGEPYIWILPAKEVFTPQTDEERLVVFMATTWRSDLFTPWRGGVCPKRAVEVRLYPDFTVKVGESFP